MRHGTVRGLQLTPSILVLTMTMMSLPFPTSNLTDLAIPVSVVPPICYLCLASTAGTRAVQRGAASRCNCARHIRFPVPERTCPAMHHTKQRWCSASSSGPRPIASDGPYARSSGVIFSLPPLKYSREQLNVRTRSYRCRHQVSSVATV